MLERGEPVAKQSRQLPLIAGRCPHRDAVLQRLPDCRLDDPVRMAEQGRRVLADKIDVAVAVEVRDLGALASDHGQRIGIEVQHGTRVTAGQVAFRLLVRRLAEWIHRHVA